MATTVTCGRADRAIPFEFEGSVAEGFVLHFASGAVTINPEFLSKIKEHFRGKRVPGGFSMDNPPASGFGAWVRDHSRQWNSRALTPRHASFLAALLRDADWVTCSYEGVAVWLDFA